MSYSTHEQRQRIHTRTHTHPVQTNMNIDLNGAHTIHTTVAAVAPSQLHVYTFNLLSDIPNTYWCGSSFVRQYDVFESLFPPLEKNTPNKFFCRSFICSSVHLGCHFPSVPSSTSFHYLAQPFVYIVPGFVDYCSIDMKLNTHDTYTQTH